MQLTFLHIKLYIDFYKQCSNLTYFHLDRLCVEIETNFQVDFIILAGSQTLIDIVSDPAIYKPSSSLDIIKPFIE